MGAMSFQRRGIGEFATAFGSLASHVKGDIEIINDDVKSYAFSNVFDVAAQLGALREGRRRQESPVRHRDAARRRHVSLVLGGARRVRDRHGRPRRDRARQARFPGDRRPARRRRLGQARGRAGRPQHGVHAARPRPSGVAAAACRVPIPRDRRRRRHPAANDLGPAFSVQKWSAICRT